MTFKEIQKIFEEKFNTSRLADIARELDVTPQVVSNWKSRNQVPYKYVKKVRRKIDKLANKNKLNIPLVSLDSLAVGNMSNDNINSGDFEQISLASLVSYLIFIVRKNILIIILTPIVFMSFIYLQATYFESPYYIAHGTILPQTNSNVSSKLSSVFTQFGFSAPVENVDINSSQLFPDIIKSRNFNHALLYRDFISKGSGSKQPLIKILWGRSPSNSNDSLRLNSFGTNRLNKMIRVITSKTKPVIKIQVVAPEPQLASDLVSAVIEELDNFQKRTKYNKIKEKRIFIDNRMLEVEKELIIVEEKLKDFREQNKNRASPLLLLNEDRLVRDVSVQYEIFTTLKQESELAQIEEVENSSMIAILDSPTLPLSSANPILLYRVITSLIFGILFSLVIIVIKEWLVKNWEEIIKALYKKH